MGVVNGGIEFAQMNLLLKMTPGGDAIRTMLTRQGMKEALAVPDVVGLAIGTRPDCVPDEVLDTLAELNKNHLIWIEYGLQSAHDTTLAAIKLEDPDVIFYCSDRGLKHYDSQIVPDLCTALIEKHRARVNPSDAQRSPTYAAMIESMDDAIGTLLDALDRLQIADNTIIIFTSDNGGNMYNEVDGTTPTSNAPLRGGKATMFEGGTRVPCVIAWPGITTAGSRSDAIIQSEDYYPTLLDGLGLAHFFMQSPLYRLPAASQRQALHEEDGPFSKSHFTYDKERDC